MSEQKQILDVLSKLEYGVHIVTMGQGQEGNALTVSWLSQVSREPAMVAVAIKSSHQSEKLLKESGAFAVCLLASDQAGVAKTYYGPAESGYQKLDGRTVAAAPVTGCPVPTGVAGFLDCKIVQQVTAGDHTVFFGEVKAAELKDGASLLSTASSGMRYRG